MKKKIPLLTVANNKFYYQFQNFKRRLTGCLLFLFCACDSVQEKPVPAQAATQEIKSSQEQLHAAFREIRTGDMITRTGNDFTSYCLRQFCQTDKTYSHCGIASVENDTVYVYHALGGEFNPDQKLLREPLAVFVAPDANRGFGLYRFNMTPAQCRELILAAQAAYQKGISFDMKFDLATDDKMYCSEFTAKMYRQAYKNDTMFALTRLPGLEYLAPDNLFLHAACKPVYKAVY
ncbi:MAG TPA: YiiX/YebB-like N1pC/P60 family cysteine hydrolase [Chitinophagaceae bacterium]|nr:YiiX/YebB-like N1pC/P60 family cysteine hydrolase [Chitinophagaceae bacterium]